MAKNKKQKIIKIEKLRRLVPKWHSGSKLSRKKRYPKYHVL